MADPNEHRSAPHSPGSGEIEPAEPLEAELVEPPRDSASAAPAPPTGADQPDGGTTDPAATDDEEYRQYQEFLEFQRFKRWQREQGGQPGDLAAPPPAAPPPAAAPRTPWWKRILRLFRFTFVRRLVYLVLLILLVPPVLQHVLTGSSGSGGGGGTGGGVPPGSVPITSTNPQRAVAGVYNYLRGDDPERTCLLFSPSGKAAFASEHGAQDCASAARRLHERITSGGQYANPSFAENAVEVAEPEAVVYGCRVRTGGGPELGSFGLTRQDDGGWLISSYDRSAPACQ
ncbi:hypothetical protein [Salinifilum aidingensis]